MTFPSLSTSHKEKPNDTIVIRLPGHRRTLLISESLRDTLFSSIELRDKIEFEMLCYRDPDVLKEKLKMILDYYKANYIEDDLELLATSDVGKPAPCNNEAYRAIQTFLKEGKDFQTALVEKYPDASVYVKRYYRKMLDY